MASRCVRHPRLYAHEMCSPPLWSKPISRGLRRWISTITSYILVMAEEARASARVAGRRDRGRSLARRSSRIAIRRQGQLLHTRHPYMQPIPGCNSTTIPDYDATIVAKLSDAGAILLGKAQHLGIRHRDGRGSMMTCRIRGQETPGTKGIPRVGRPPVPALPSRRGRRCSRWAAIPAGRFALPAAACGLQGLKPTYGLVSRYGMLPNCWAFDTVGPLCWSVWDCSSDPPGDRRTGSARSGLRPASRTTIWRSWPTSVAGLTIGFIADGRL